MQKFIFCYWKNEKIPKVPSSATPTYWQYIYPPPPKALSKSPPKSNVAAAPFGRLSLLFTLSWQFPQFADLQNKSSHWNYQGRKQKKIFPDCNKTINDCNSTVTVIDGPVTVCKNFYSFGLRSAHTWPNFLRRPWKLFHFYQPVLVCVVYQAFNYVYVSLGGTSYHNEPYIYNMFDWNNPSR